MPVNMKLMIASTFAQMAKQKNIDKITVKDLVAACGISRQAFYYHFQDLLEVMEWCIRQMMQQALQNSLQAATPEKSLEEFIRMAIDHQDLIMRLLCSQRREQVERIFAETMRSGIEQILRSHRPDLTLNYEDLNIALNFYSYGIAGTVFEHCKSQTTNPEQLSKTLYRLISGSFV